MIKLSQGIWHFCAPKLSRSSQIQDGYNSQIPREFKSKSSLSFMQTEESVIESRQANFPKQCIVTKSQNQGVNAVQLNLYVYTHPFWPIATLLVQPSRTLGNMSWLPAAISEY